jgi:hypothetical protein
MAPKVCRFRQRSSQFIPNSLMRRSLVDVLEGKALIKVLAPVSLAWRVQLAVVCKEFFRILRTGELRIERAASGWGPEKLVCRTDSSAAMVDIVLRWLYTFPDVTEELGGYSFENQRVEMEVGEPGDGPFDHDPLFFKFAQIRVPGPQVPAFPILGCSLDDLDPKDASARLRDAWWVVARSIFAGTPLPDAMTCLALVQHRDSEDPDQPGTRHPRSWWVDQGYEPPRPESDSFMALIWTGRQYGLLSCQDTHYSPTPYCTINVWGGVSADWVQGHLLNTLVGGALLTSTFTGLCKVFESLLDEEIPSTWNESWRFAQGTDWEHWPDVHSEDLSSEDIVGNMSQGQRTAWADSYSSTFLNEVGSGKHEVLHCPFSDTISSEADADNTVQRTDCDVIEEVNRLASSSRKFVQPCLASRDEDVLQMVGELWAKRRIPHQCVWEEASWASSAKKLLGLQEDSSGASSAEEASGASSAEEASGASSAEVSHTYT